MSTGRPQKQICKYGHDTSIVGRLKNRTCVACNNGKGAAPANKRRHKWNTVNPKTQREWSWKKRRITNADGSQFTTVDYDRAYQIQQGRCAICKKHQSDLDQTLAADHDHKTDRFRGLLCAPCNTSLGTYEKVKDVAETYLNNLPL